MLVVGVAAVLLAASGSSYAATGTITLTDDDSEELASTLIADIRAAKVKPINGHLKVDSILCNPNTSHCSIRVNGKNLPLITGSSGLALVDLFEEIEATVGAADGGNNIDCVVIGPPKCTIRQDLKASLDGGVCGSDVAIRTSCAPDLTCVFPTGGPITEHRAGRCQPGCTIATDCPGDAQGRALCCPRGGAAIIRPLACFAFSSNGCPAFP
jgi:hypothetical protein